MFNLFTSTVWSGTHYDCVTIMLLLRGFAQGTPTLQLVDELELDYETELNRRHDLQQLVLDHKPTAPLADTDEMLQNTGEDDGAGFCEVHCNTMEGIWTGLRNFLRPFRGVHKKYLAVYVALFEWAHNLTRVTADFLRT
jgi:hypothetical protein